MPFSTSLVERVISFLPTDIILEEKKMMGGLILMVNEKMCIGIDIDKKTEDNRLMIRIGKERYDEALDKRGCRKMDFTGREMKGFVFVYPEGFSTDYEMKYWVDLAVAYNTIAPLRKKKRK